MGSHGNPLSRTILCESLGHRVTASIEPHVPRCFGEASIQSGDVGGMLPQKKTQLCILCRVAHFHIVAPTFLGDTGLLSNFPRHDRQAWALALLGCWLKCIGCPSKYFRPTGPSTFLSAYFGTVQQWHCQPFRDFQSVTPFCCLIKIY